MKITDWNVREWDVPMRSPYRSAQRLTTTAHNVLVAVTLEGGFTGYGESAPATYVTGETQASVADALRRFFAHHGKESMEDALARAATELGESPGARGAAEIAIRDAQARFAGIPLYRLFNPERIGEEPYGCQTDLSLPILSPEEAADRTATASLYGFRSFKIKVGGGDAAEDAARVRAVAEAAPDATLRLDGNQAFTADTALSLLDGLTDLFPRIDLFEQPTPAGDDAAMLEVHRSLPDDIPVFADESCHNATDARRLIESGICGGVVLKLAKSGLADTERIARAAYAAGGACLFGCMMETHIGIGAALHLAVALGEEIVPFFDLDGHYLTDDSQLLTGGFADFGPTLAIDSTVAGLGVHLL